MIRRLAVLLGLFLWTIMSARAFALDNPEGFLLPKPLSSYTEQSEANIPITLNYSASSYGAGVVLRIGSSDKLVDNLPSLEEQGRILDHLLGRLFKEHPDKPATILFSPGESKETLVELLDKRLQEPQADWDAKTGRPRQGPFGVVVKTELEKALLSSPISKAFEAHGYTLRLENIGRIDIQPIKELGGGHFPKYIDTMEIQAVKMPSKG